MLASPAHFVYLRLSNEGGAVGALAHGGVGLVGGNLDLVESAVVIASGMVLALADSAFDVLVVSAVLVIVHC